jgi:hypothetical protein
MDSGQFRRDMLASDSMNAPLRLAVAVPMLLTFGFSGAQAQVVAKTAYISNVDGNRFFVTDFQRKSANILSYQLSTNLVNWGPPNSGGRPGISTSVSSEDLLITSVRINQPVSAAPRYFVRALYEIKRSTRLDFDGDGKTDYVLVRNTGGGPTGATTWFITLSGGGTKTILHGNSGDDFIPGDYDGDGLCDAAVRTPSTSIIKILQSSDGVVRTLSLGQSGDNSKVMADYDGDGKTDPAVFRNTPGADSFIYIGSLNNPSQTTTTVTFPTTGSFPNPGDYDGDLKTDCCVQVNAGGGNANFIIRRSKDNVIETNQFGTPTDVVTSADYDGDLKYDIIITRGSAGMINWGILERDGGGTGANLIPFGASATDFPSGGDYDGDGKFDLATWTPSATAGMSNFKVRRSSDGVTTTVNLGLNGDYPVANVYSH